MSKGERSQSTTRELLKKIRKIEIYTSKLVNDKLAGQYQSVFKGRGMAFSEVRQYQPGDDVRIIDWNVSARMNEPFVKLFVEEREMTVMLLVDMSASGRFGSLAQSKRDLAAEVAALVAFSAIKNNDRVGLIVFTDRVELFVPPKKGKKHVLRVISEILTFEPASPLTDIRAGLEYLGKIARRRSVAFLVTDFLAEGWAHALRVASRKHDLIPVVIGDPMEEKLPRLGLVNFEDFETGQVFEFDTSGAESRQHAQLVKRRREEREQLLKRLKIDFVNVRTDRPYVDALVSFFRARERRLRH
ncbi:MAG: DUF58 domain-containing protein [Deltaproteobacteria bacterium]|nr:DUF58 domain-containing protein [Deltaproteobacteria bacterium]